MKKLVLISLLVNATFLHLIAQRGGPPRRIENPETVNLDSGSRIEFHTFESKAIGKAASYSIFLPPSYDSDAQRRFPVVYFLHGMWNDHTSWTTERYGKIPEQIQELMVSGKAPEFIIVQPDGENGFYTDSLDGTRRYERMVYEDLIAEIDSTYRTKASREFRSIGGVSMGGYGSFKIALKKPELFAAMASVSPIILVGDDPSKMIMGSQNRMAQYLSEALKPVFGMPFDLAHWKENSVEELARTSACDGLKIFFAFGTADRYADNFPMEVGLERIDSILTERNVDHTYRVYENGPHGWQLVADHLEEVTRFLSQTF